MHRHLRFAALALGLSCGAAHAFTPESGFWWNPNEAGRGYNIEIQDNVLALSVYAFANGGAATWYTSAGTLQGNARYTGQLDAFTGGQCLSCNYNGFPATQTGAGGPVSIVFNTETTATMTIGGRTFNIERQNFRLGDKTELMLGEWQAVIDFYTEGSQEHRDFPYIGDLLVLDLIDRAPSPDYFEGCRATRSDDGYCRSSALRDHDAAGYYNPGTGEHLIVVKDQPGSGLLPAIYLAYFIEVGTDQFDGVVEVYDEDEHPGNGPYYPVRGFRSASRSFVQTGTGPSEASDKARDTGAAASISALLTAQGKAMPEGLSAEQVKARFGFDPRESASDVARITDHLRAKSNAKR